MSPYQRMIEALHGVQDQRVSAAVLAWLKGQPLTDPAALAFVKQFYQDPAQAQQDVPQGVRLGATAPAAPQNTGSAVPPGTTNGPLPSLMQPQAPPKLGAGLAQGAQSAGNLAPTLGAGVAQGAATAGGLAQAWINSRNNTQPNPVPGAAAAPTQQTPQKAGGTTMADPTGGGQMPGGGLQSVAQGAAVGPGGANDFRIAAVLQSLGLDPTSHGLRTEYLKQFLGPLLQARGESLGLGAEGTDATSYLDTLKNFAQGFTTAGRNGYGEAANFAQGVLGGNAFQEAAKTSDPKALTQQLQNLLSLSYAGQNPFVQAAGQNVFNDANTNYQLNQLGEGGATPFNGVFTQYASQNQQSPIARLLAGIYGR